MRHPITRRETLRALPLAGAVAQALCQGNGLLIETPALRFEVSERDGTYRLTDKAAGVMWRSHASRFGEIAVAQEGKVQRLALAACEAAEGGGELVLTFRPLAERREAVVRVRVKSAGARTLEFSFETAGGMEAEEIRLLDGAFGIGADERGYAVVPAREGLLIPAESGLRFRQRFGASDYQGCHMTMMGMVKAGAALLVTWTDPYVAVEIQGDGGLVASAILRKSARSVRVTVLGKGDYVTVARAYREVARAKGYLVTWDEKLKGHPERAKYLGASNVKLWQAVNRRMNEESTEQLSVRVNWSFDEAAQVAEHVKRDLKMEKVLFGLGGWTRRGYDNQHPDILPAAPEAGGDQGLADCARRVMQLGYLLALHDNYQDMYRDAPSWDEQWIMKTRDGGLAKGGRWAGGRAYLTCSKEAVELARRPQNLPAVKRLTAANAYFIDTTYAVGLQECFDPRHPLTKADDMKWKQEISDYARGLFGSFGSEDGREWAIPHADFFEGLTGVSGSSYHNSGSDLLKEVGGRGGAVVRDGVPRHYRPVRQVRVRREPRGGIRAAPHRPRAAAELPLPASTPVLEWARAGAARASAGRGEGSGPVRACRWRLGAGDALHGPLH